jgi:hypothetical protein
MLFAMIVDINVPHARINLLIASIVEEIEPLLQIANVQLVTMKITLVKLAQNVQIVA